MTNVPSCIYISLRTDISGENFFVFVTISRYGGHLIKTIGGDKFPAKKEYANTIKCTGEKRLQEAREWIEKHHPGQEVRVQ